MEWHERPENLNCVLFSCFDFYSLFNSISSKATSFLQVFLKFWSKKNLHKKHLKNFSQKRKNQEMLLIYKMFRMYIHKVKNV